MFAENILVSAVQFINRGDIDDCTVKPHSVVVLDVLCHEPPGVLKRKRRFWSDAFSFQRLVESFKLPVGLRIVR